jgi:hypothetical protein
MALCAHDRVQAPVAAAPAVRVWNFRTCTTAQLPYRLARKLGHRRDGAVRQLRAEGLFL